MIRLMLRAHRPHFGRQPKHLYTWPGVDGGRTAVVTMVRTSRSVRKLQEQMIMKAGPARGPQLKGESQSLCRAPNCTTSMAISCATRRMATLGGRRRHFDCCPSLCLLLLSERHQWRRLQREFVYSRVIAPNSIATQFATGRSRRSQRRRASPGIKRAGGWSFFRPAWWDKLSGRNR
jgi:hypothetical protein